ncbi:MAG: asparagine--tRNA ligase [Gemmatimonadota bacterium]|nr:asparagine--tRNA ligase [Gemmatimonadota bacterium]
MAVPISISRIAEYDGRTVLLQGWLQNKRSSGKLRFLQLRDGTGVVQCVLFKGDVPPDLFERSAVLTQESSLRVWGVVREDKRSPLGFEVGVTGIEVVQASEPYPITPKAHGTAFLMDHRHLWLRSSRQHAILRVRSEVIRACRNYFDERDFVLTDSPIFTPSSCEGTTTLFQTDYFDDQAYLTQSGQLYVEASAMAFGKVYCFGPTFRAEKSKTRRHLTEFWMVEPEVAYLDLNGDMDLAEDFVSTVVQQVLERRREELVLLDRDLEPLERVKKPFPRISYTDAVDILNRRGVSHRWGDDFGGDEETVLAEQFDRPVLVHRYPASCKAFYMKGDPDDGRLALCMDMLAPEGYGEIIGGGQREDDLEELRRKIAEHRLDETPFQWYLDLRRYGSVPHAGFGLGIERTVAWICGLRHVRETIPFPRMLQRLYP